MSLCTCRHRGWAAEGKHLALFGISYLFTILDSCQHDDMKESIRTTSISCCGFQHPGGCWQIWTTYQKQFRVAAPLSNYEKGHACPHLLRSLLGDPPLFSADWKASASTSGFGSRYAVDNCLLGQNVHFWPNKQMSKAHTVQTTGQRTCLKKVPGRYTLLIQQWMNFCEHLEDWSSIFRVL